MNKSDFKMFGQNQLINQHLKTILNVIKDMITQKENHPTNILKITIRRINQNKNLLFLIYFPLITH